MEASLSRLALLMVSAFLAGALNAVAGGGSFLTFPALILAGLPATAANASSTAALFPATFASAAAYRRDFAGLAGLDLRAFLLVSLAGGVAGSLLLLWTPERTFVSLTPWLLLFATVLFAFGRPLSAALRRRVRLTLPVLLAIQALIAVYGGYFGGGIGILMLAAFGLYGLTDLNAMNGAKNVLAGTLNGVAVVVFMAAHKIWWREALIMMVAGVAGGYLGARAARRVDQRWLRAGVIAVGTAMSVYFFARPNG